MSVLKRIVDRRIPWRGISYTRSDWLPSTLRDILRITQDVAGPVDAVQESSPIIFFFGLSVLANSPR